MTGDEVRGVLDPRQPLHLRLHQVAGLGGDADQQAEHRPLQRRQAEHEDPARDHDRHRAHEPSQSALDRLLGADRREEGVAAQPAADQEGSGVAHHDGHDDEHHPGDARRPPGVVVEKQVVVERQADVDGAGQAHGPAAEPLAAAWQD